MKIGLEEAALRLEEGDIVAIPTETVYGLAASLFRKEAIEALFVLKKRKGNKPITLSVGAASEIVPFMERVPPRFELLSSFWPGPLTLVVPTKKDPFLQPISSSEGTTGFRIPDHPLTKELLNRVGPLVLSSANLASALPATCPEEIERVFGASFPILLGGTCPLKVASTVIGFREGKWDVYREGAIPIEDFAPILGYVPKVIGSLL